MKKKTKKLVLKKETMTALEAGLVEVAAASAWTCYKSCGSYCPINYSYDVYC